MWDFILANGNLPFTLAFALILAIGLIQVLGLLIGLSAAEALDDGLPDLDLDAPGPVGQAFAWLCFGRLPFLIWLLLWLLTFALLGWTLQWLALGLMGTLLPALWPALAALALSLPLQRRLSLALLRVLPTTESSAVSQDALIGLAGEISQGVASQQRPAEVAVVDAHGHKHYVMARPYDDLTLHPGDKVLLFALEDGIYLISPFPG
ncbi:OB-fold-containig protein [Gallaecimonas sp. GXIMD4217]|uniref:OB-fold-containig protein n=1 Tax=Gallaecimonas sp. GXIMD4217 TaxID=3131927 RepID=UPI00311AEE23